MAATSATPVDLTENHNAQIITVGVIFCTLSTTAVIMRLWSKTMKNGIKIDDYFLIAAQIMVLGWNIMAISGIKWNGLGYHVAALTPQQIINFKKTFFVSNFLQPTSLVLAKISLLLLLNMLFPGRAFRWTARVLGGIVVAYWVTAIVGELTICTPIRSQWDSTVTPHCGNLQWWQFGIPIPWIATDVAILIAPLPMLKDLQLPRAQKWGLFALFLVGILTCVVSIIRYTTLWYSVEDVSFDIVPAALWGIIETNITTFCAAIIACRPVLTLMYPGKFISSISEKYLGYATGSRSRSGYKRSKDSSGDRYPNSDAMDTPLTDVSSRKYPSNAIKVTREIGVNYDRAEKGI